MSQHLHRINGVKSVSFAGAWMGFGFHEDGFAAGAHVARMLMDGREKTAPLDLVSGVDETYVRSLGIMESMLKLGIFAVQKLLLGGKNRPFLE